MSFLRGAMFIFCVLLGGFFRDVQADELQNGGRTKFEIFGMMDEYGMDFSPFDGQRIANFYPNEAALAPRFAKLLDAYCTEEGVSHGFIEEEEPGGGVAFVSPAIAKSIRSHYEKGGMFGQSGTLRPSEFENASNLDLLRYLRGAYSRYNYKESEVIIAGNSTSKVHNLAVILSKLGCKGVRFYLYEAVPVSDVLIFSPTEKIRQFLGIQRTIRFDELSKGFEGGLKLHEQIGSD